MTEKAAGFRCLVEKSHVRKESGVMTHGKREVDEGTPSLGNDKKNVAVDKVVSYF